MKTPARLVMVSAATAAVVVAGWQVRPSSGSDEADAVLVTTPAAAISTLPATEDPGATVVISEQAPSDDAPTREDAGEGSAQDGRESAAEAGPGASGESTIEQATPVDGFLSAAPLDIDFEEDAVTEPKPEAAELLGCRAYIGEQIRRDEAGLIDWDALDTYVELSADDYNNLETEFIAFEESMLEDGERPTLVDIGGPVDLESLEIERLVGVTDRCWDLGVYQEIEESIYDEIYSDE